MRNWQKSDVREFTIVAGTFVALVLGIHGAMASLNLITRGKSPLISLMGIVELALAAFVAWYLVQLDSTGKFPTLHTMRGEITHLRGELAHLKLPAPLATLLKKKS